MKNLLHTTHNNKKIGKINRTKVQIAKFSSAQSADHVAYENSFFFVPSKAAKGKNWNTKIMNNLSYTSFRSELFYVLLKISTKWYELRTLLLFLLLREHTYACWKLHSLPIFPRVQIENQHAKPISALLACLYWHYHLTHNT